MKLHISLLVLSVVLLVSVACAGEPAPTPTPALAMPPSPTALAMTTPTLTATPTATQVPPIPAGPTPNATLTLTPTPTVTVITTATQVLPTPVPATPVAPTSTATPTLSPPTTATVVQTVPPAPGSLEQRLDRLAEQLEQRREDLHIPGMAIAVVKDDEVILVRGFGLADLENETPVTPETIFGIGSITKSFTATLVGMLVDEGEMGWDDPATEHIPYFTP